MDDFMVEILEVIRYLQRMFVKDLPEDQVMAYVEHLADINPVKLRMAAVRCVETKVFFPKVAELRGLAGEAVIVPLREFILRRVELVRESRVHGVNRAAWSSLERDLRRAGYWSIADYAVEMRERLEKKEAQANRFKLFEKYFIEQDRIGTSGQGQAAARTEA